jgi:DNA sulfur modification protein DndE
MIVETVRISESGKQQLIRVKAKTGIKHWNILGRWALAMSLAEQSAPPTENQNNSGAIEIAWKVFAGPLSGPLEAAIRMRLLEQRAALPDISEQEFFHLHLHRGISYLASSVQRSVADMLSLVRVV